MSRVDDIIMAVVRREGGFSHLAADRGGATRWGITQTTLSAWRGKAVTIADVQALTEIEAADIYQALYFTRPGINQLWEGLQPVMLDFAVNSGPQVAIMALQEILGIKPDGIIGPFTVAASFAHANSTGANPITALTKWRVMMLGRIVRRDPSQLVFLAGWLSRALSFIA